MTQSVTQSMSQSRTAPDLMDRVAEAARRLQTPASVGDMVVAIAEEARAAVPGADHAGVYVVDGEGHSCTPGATHDLARLLGEIQQVTHEGPCVDSFGSPEVVTVDEVAHEQRWPAYVPLALEAGVHSQLAVRLQVTRRQSAALFVGSTGSHALHPQAVELVRLFAVLASSALGAAQRASQQADALDGRTLIGTAVGITMARYGLTRERAHEFLLRRSQDGNVKLRRVAEEVVAEAERTAGGRAGTDHMAREEAGTTVR